MTPRSLVAALCLATSLVAQVPSAKDAKAKAAPKVEAAKEKAGTKVDAAAAKADTKASGAVGKAEAKTGKAAPAAAASSAIVGNKDSKTFHRADCKTAARMKPANKTAFASAAEAQKAGYTACKVCKP